MFQELLSQIHAHNTIILHRHKNPDGDALGSQIGLKHILTDSFPGKTVYAVGDSAGHYSFMDGSVMDEIPDSVYADALAIVLDTSAKHLISDDRYQIAHATARLDHHIFVEKICQTEITDTSYESCCGLVTEFALQCGLTISAASAKALYTGMITDSGRFRYDSTSANTFRLASALMERKFDLNDIYRQLYADDFSRIRLKAQFVLKIKFTDCNVAYIYTTKEELSELNVDTFSVSRGMVSTMSDIKGVDIWVNFTETEQGVLCELRSSKYNINPIAVKYGGGGHAKASGATVAGKEIAMQMLSDLDALTKE